MNVPAGRVRTRPGRRSPLPAGSYEARPAARTGLRGLEVAFVGDDGRWRVFGFAGLPAVGWHEPLASAFAARTGPGGQLRTLASAVCAWGTAGRFLRFVASEQPVPADPAMLRAAHLAAGVPVTALVVAAAFTIVAAEETRLYLVAGPVGALLRFFVVAVLVVASLTMAWLTLASQRLTSSLRSAGRSATITAPYALLLTAVGGWVVGLPGTFGPGRIHVGWVTSISTAILLAAFLWSQFINKTQEDEPETSAAIRQAKRSHKNAGKSKVPTVRRGESRGM